MRPTAISTTRRGMVVEVWEWAVRARALALGACIAGPASDPLRARACTHSHAPCAQVCPCECATSSTPKRPHALLHSKRPHALLHSRPSGASVPSEASEA
eukprot:6200660-Pleurochrysis_carterae.AAC.2